MELSISFDTFAALPAETGQPAVVTMMSSWPVPFSFASVVTPLSLISVFLTLRHKSNPARVHALILTLLFLVVQHLSLFHATPSVTSALRQRELVYATVGAALQFSAALAATAMVYFVFMMLSMLFAWGVLLISSGEIPAVRVPDFAQGLFQEVCSRLNINSYSAVSTTTATTRSFDGSYHTTTTTSREEVPIQLGTSEYSGIVDRLMVFASPIIATLALLPIDVVNTITSFVIIPSRTLLFMDSSSEHGGSEVVSHVIRLANAGAVGLWYTNELLMSIWRGGTSNNNMSKSIGNALKKAWWFLLGVMAQVFVTASVLQRDMTWSGAGAIRVGWIVLQLRVAMRLMESIQDKLTGHWRFVAILLEVVKACLVFYFGMLCWEAVYNLMSAVAAKYATA